MLTMAAMARHRSACVSAVILLACSISAHPWVRSGYAWESNAYAWVRNGAAAPASACRSRRGTVRMVVSDPPRPNTQKLHVYERILTDYEKKMAEKWRGHENGFDWQLERARRTLEGPAFAPLRMTFWSPIPDSFVSEGQPRTTFYDAAKIIFNNILQQLGLAESYDGAPVAEIQFTGNGLKGLSELIPKALTGKLEEIAGGPLFLLLEQYAKSYGSVYKLAFGPKSFIVVSDPVIAKHILRTNAKSYDKGILAEILEPIMGKGLIPADPQTWKLRRRAIVPGFHKRWLNAMMSLFHGCNEPLVAKLEHIADTEGVLDMETEFCSVSLDIIGKAVFNFEFGSVTKESPVIKAVYSALREAEHRSTSFIPYWKLPFADSWMPQLSEFQENMRLLNSVLDTLIGQALATQQKADVEELEQRPLEASEDMSLLRFLVDMRGEDTTTKQLRDDLMTLLVAGHETTAAVLTWSLFELCQHPRVLRKVQHEIDTVVGDRAPAYDDLVNLPNIRNVIAESLRLYPEPPLLIRRALAEDTLPLGGADVAVRLPKGADVFIATWNIHRSSRYWKDPHTFNPDRFSEPFQNLEVQGWGGFNPSLVTGLYPGEIAADFAFLPFGGGSRKCVGDQFALMESAVILAVLLRRFEFSMTKTREEVGMRTGATIHTATGLHMKVRRRTDVEKSGWM